MILIKLMTLEESLEPAWMKIVFLMAKPIFNWIFGTKSNLNYFQEQR